MDKVNLIFIIYLAIASTFCFWWIYKYIYKRKVITRPKVICICGSGRFLNEMHNTEERLTLSGCIVLMIGVNTKDAARTDELEKFKPMLDELHLRKIDLSDEVFVVNVDGYIGESTRNEINYAESIGKPIKYLGL